MLGGAGFGQYIAISAIVQLTAVIADAGLNRVLIRDVAVDPRLALSYVGTVRRARLGLSLVAVAAALLAAPFLGAYGGGALALGALGMVPMADARTSEGVLYAHGLIRRAAALSACLAMARFILSVGLAALGFGVAGVLAAQSVAAVAYAGLMRLASPRFQADDTPSPLSLRQLARSSYPFAILAALEALYARLDVLIIAVVTGSATQVGLYGAAYKIYEAATIPSASFAAVQVPGFARRLAARDATLASTVWRSVTWSLVVGIVAAIVLTPNASNLVRLVYGNSYEGASGALAGLGSAMIAGFAVYPLAALLAASHEQRAILGRSLAQIAINGIANLVLVATLGITGAGLAMVATTMSGAIMFGLLARRILAASESDSAPRTESST